MKYHFLFIKYTHVQRKKKKKNESFYLRKYEMRKRRNFIQLTDDRNQLQFLQLIFSTSPSSIDELIIFTLNMHMIALPDDKWRVRFHTLYFVANTHHVHMHEFRRRSFSGDFLFPL